MSDKINQKMLEALKLAAYTWTGGYVCRCQKCVHCRIRLAIESAEPKPHAFTGKIGDPDSANCICGKHMSHEIHIRPNEPTLQELIDALRRAEQLLSRPSRPYVEEMRDRVIFNEILAKCDPKPEPIRRWLVESPDHPSVGLGRAKITIVMPITRLQIEGSYEQVWILPG